jgi:predicted esterase
MQRKTLRFVGFVLLGLALLSPVAESMAIDKVAGTQSAMVELQRIRDLINPLLDTEEPALYHRHLQSVLAICEEEVLKAQIAGPSYSSEEEMLGYLKAIEAALKRDDARESKAYLSEGMRALDISRLSLSDGTIQLYTVQLPEHWDPNKAYPLWVQLHGRWSDLPLALVASSLDPPSKEQEPDQDAIIVTPWVRGNSDYRLKYGSEPDVWEAINNVKKFAKLDANRWYISGHSWGGDDTWSIVLRTPDLWAAAGIMAGHPHAIPDELGLVANASHVPFYLWRGDADPTKGRIEAFNYFQTALTSVGDSPMSVVAHGVPHMYRPEDLAALHAWLFEHVRHRPTHFSYIVDTPDHRGVWGVSVPIRYETAYYNVEPVASFQCQTKGATVLIEARGTHRLDVDLGPTGLNITRKVRLFVNGKQLFYGPPPEKPLPLSW